MIIRIPIIILAQIIKITSNIIFNYINIYNYNDGYDHIIFFPFYIFTLFLSTQYPTFQRRINPKH